MRLFLEIYFFAIAALAVAIIIPSCFAQEYRLTDQLGSAQTIVRQATRVEAGQLSIVSAQEAKSNALKSTDRIAGYPIEGKLKALKSADTDILAKLILDDKNYSTVRQRCRNKHLIGLRFTKNHKVVEFALGMPCQQVIWAFKEDEGVEYIGAVIGSEAALKIISLFESK